MVSKVVSIVVLNVVSFLLSKINSNHQDVILKNKHRNHEISKHLRPFFILNIFWALEIDLLDAPISSEISRKDLNKNCVSRHLFKKFNMLEHVSVMIFQTNYLICPDFQIFRLVNLITTLNIIKKIYISFYLTCL